MSNIKKNILIKYIYIKITYNKKLLLTNNI